jgi:hypothetical protein
LISAPGLYSFNIGAHFLRQAPTRYSTRNPPLWSFARMKLKFEERKNFTNNFGNSYCGKSFTRDEHLGKASKFFIPNSVVEADQILEKHILTHTNIKPFLCFTCHMSFARRYVATKSCTRRWGLTDIVTCFKDTIQLTAEMRKTKKDYLRMFSYLNSLRNTRSLVLIAQRQILHATKHSRVHDAPVSS